MRENLRVIRQFGRGRGAPAAVALAGRGAGEQWCVWFVHVKVLNMYMCARAFGRSSGGLCVFCDPTKVAVMEPDKRRALSCILVAAWDSDSPAGTDGGVRSQNGPNSLVGTNWCEKAIHAYTLGGLA